MEYVMDACPWLAKRATANKPYGGYSYFKDFLRIDTVCWFLVDLGLSTS